MMMVHHLSHPISSICVTCNLGGQFQIFALVFVSSLWVLSLELLGMHKGWVAFVWFFTSSNVWDMSFHSLATKTRFLSPRDSW
jgi:hypothetical protein